MLGASRRSLCVGTAVTRHAAASLAASGDAAAAATATASPANPPRSVRTCDCRRSVSWLRFSGSRLTGMG
jgi:hypothetical protein